MMQGKPISADPFKRMHGSDVTVEWLENDESAMKEPIVIEKPDGLGMKMPEDLTVSDVGEIMGEDTPVEVIGISLDVVSCVQIVLTPFLPFADVASQANIPGWTLGKWVEYYETEPAQRDKIRNVISLEISGSELANKVLPPRLVRETDWVEKFWPNTKKGRGHSYPKVQLYCLMGVEKAWTVSRPSSTVYHLIDSRCYQDWHIDFAGSSVYYHIISGQKVSIFHACMDIGINLLHRSSTLSALLLRILPLTSDGQGQTYRTIRGLAICATKSSKSSLKLGTR